VLKGSNSIRVIVLAALVLAVAFSSTIGSRLALGRAAAAATVTKQSSDRAVEQQNVNSAWQAQLSDERSLLQHAQQQQELAQQQTELAQQQTASAPSTLLPPAAAAAAAGGSVEAIIDAAFAPLGATAQQWGLCIAQHESGDNPSAIQPGEGGAEGLFQFEPGTWGTTPQGEAGESIFDAAASSQAAAWEYGNGNYDAWTTNADFCSMYD
jgi:hypothetical protein